jgi:hypothetical protein
VQSNAIKLTENLGASPPEPSRTLRVLVGRPAAHAAPASPDVPHVFFEKKKQKTLALKNRSCKARTIFIEVFIELFSNSV